MRRWLIGVCCVALGCGTASAAVLTLTCSASTTVPCSSAWAFEDPIPSSTCPTGNGYVDWQPFVTTTSGVCPKVVTRTWTVTDYCGNTQSCSQSVTLLDPAPPAALCSGINLVPNPSFENRVACPEFLGQVPLAAPWQPPTQGTSDYYNNCSTGVLVNVPGNFAGTQAAYSGQAYMGAIVYRDTGNGPLTTYREYIQAPLIAPLVSGVTYRLSFFVSRAEQSPAAVADIGAHFSSYPVQLPGDNYVLPVTPQVVNPATNILLSTTAWMEIAGAYTATGGEAFLTLGNFQSDAATTVTQLSAVDEYTYYYFDEISLTALCPSSVTGKTVDCAGPWSFDPPRAVDACSGTNVTVTVSATVTNQPCPLVLTRHWTLTDPCGNTNGWSQAVTVTNNSAPQVICECIADTAVAALNTNSCAGIVPDLTGAGACVINPCGSVTLTQQPPAGTVFGPGSYAITVRVENCAGLVSTCAVPFHVYPLVPTLAVPTNLVVLTCSNSLPVSFLVGAVGHSGPVVATPPSGSVFTQGVTTVSCVATSACGGVASNTFTVTVKPPRTRWFCNLVGVGIGIPYKGLGGATIAARTAGGDYPAVVVTPESALSTNGGLQLNPGPADAVTFTTVLHFPAEPGAGFDLLAPPHAHNTNGLPLLSVRGEGTNEYAVRAYPYFADLPGGAFRTLAVATNGNLLDSTAYPAAAAATNPVLMIPAVPGVTSCHVTVELDLRTGRMLFDYPGTLDPSARHKGWDGCIYGPDRPVKKPKSRVVILPPVAPGQPPMPELALRFSGWPELIVEEPSLTRHGRKWSDGHVTLMKAYEEADEQGVEFLAAGPGAGVSVDLGYASNVSFQVRHQQDASVPAPEQYLKFRGGPGDMVLQLRLAQNAGTGGMDIYIDTLEWDAAAVTVQLWSGGGLVGEAPHRPASLSVPLVTLDRFPAGFDVSHTGTLRLTDPNPLIVTDGLDCGGLPCVGDELRIIPEYEPAATPPSALLGLDFGVSEDMDQQLYGLQSTPACADIPIHSTRTTNGVEVSWAGDGFRLQGAESADGPWYDLGASSPVTLSAGVPLRVFRLRCD